MRRTALVLTLGLAVTLFHGCDDDDDGTGPEDDADFSASLSGNNELPPVETGATGEATFEVEGETLLFRIDVENIQDVIAAHIHIGGSTVEGPVAVALFSNPEGVDIDDGVLAQGEITAVNINPAVDLPFDELLDLLEDGSTYVNVHTIANPDGEIRGQVTGS
jgi:hypothetical protein